MSLCVIVELGSAYARVGYCGEAMPRRRLASPFLEEGDDESNVSCIEVWLSEVVSDVLLVAKASQVSIVIVENETASRGVREALVSALAALGPKKVAFCPALVAAAGATARETVLLLNVGKKESRAMAVVQGFALAESFVVSNLGSASVEHVCAIDRCYARRRRSDGNTDGDDRGSAAEALFDGGEPIDGDEGGGLARLVVRCLAKCPVDARKHLARAIAPLGGGSLIPGFDLRLLDDLRHLDNTTTFALEHFAFSRPDVPWVGASLLVDASLKANRFYGLDPNNLDLPDFFAVGLKDKYLQGFGITFAAPATKRPPGERRGGAGRHKAGRLRGNKAPPLLGGGRYLFV